MCSGAAGLFFEETRVRPEMFFGGGVRMRVTIVGGGLQGVELCWLARKAGWETLLVDERPAPPALRLADDFIRCDVTGLGGSDVRIRKAAHRIFRTDIVIPALEDAAALAVLGNWCAREGMLFAFDPAAYAVTASKLRSRDLFRRCGTPIPQPAAKAEKAFPIIAKPSEGSGSRGVRLLKDEAELFDYIPGGFDAEGWILESYCPGPSFSLEICGTPGNYKTFQVTDLLMDEAFDCRGVLAPADAPPSVSREMEAELLQLAEALQLRGLMDLEVILAPDGMRVLEIDARFPSQTPTAVWLSTGINLAEHLVSCFFPSVPGPGFEGTRVARYEHVLCQDGSLHFLGEHIMGQFGPLVPVGDFYGADEALVGGNLLSGSWAATLMFTGRDAEDVMARREGCMAHLRALAAR